MLRLTLRLCRASGDNPSNADNVAGGDVPLGRCELNEARRSSSDWSTALADVLR